MIHPHANPKTDLPRVLLIGGLDSSGSAGLNVDLKMLYSLGVEAYTAPSALTVQTHQEVSYAKTTDQESFCHHLESSLLRLEGLEEKIIKTGMLGSLENLKIIIGQLKGTESQVVCDPVLFSSSGKELLEPDSLDIFIKDFLPLVFLLTPNLKEVEILLGRKVTTPIEIEVAAKDLVNLGVKSVLIKGGHADGIHSSDYFFDGKDSCWIFGKRVFSKKEFRGTGCSLASSIAGGLSLGLELKDAIVMARILINKSIRLAKDDKEAYILNPQGSFNNQLSPLDLPWVTSSWEQGNSSTSFPGLDLPGDKIDLYPIVDRADWLHKIFKNDVKIVQLRVKDLIGVELEREIEKAVEISRQYHGRLFINDYWELAIKYGAYGIHLGQEDLAEANIKKILESGIRLGISTHSYYEGAVAHGIRPSYIALGPIYFTALKAMKFKPQGIETLKLWRQLFNYPLVAIGGINLERAFEVMDGRPDIISVVRDITLSDNPERKIEDWNKALSRGK